MISDSKSFCTMTFVLSSFQLEQMLTIEKKATKSSSQQKICFTSDNGLLVLMSKKSFQRWASTMLQAKLTNYGFEFSTTEIWQVLLKKGGQKRMKIVTIRRIASV